MKPKSCFLFLLFIPFFTTAQDTFSIVAVDSATGQVGSAGASCINGCSIISDVHPGVGAIHTQALWLGGNQSYAQTLMDMGLAPQQIIDSLVKNDAQNNPTVRQYGIVDLTGGGRSAAYTGINCSDWKGHVTGKNYSIQGNILLGKQIIDSMEARFLREEGDLACKLMAAMQGANVIGADTRCASTGQSTKSAFLKVANPGDMGSYWMDIEVFAAPPYKEPIDSLQKLFNAQHSCATGIAEAEKSFLPLVQVFPNPAPGDIVIKANFTYEKEVTVNIYDVKGELLMCHTLTKGSTWSIGKNVLQSGIYFYKASSQEGKTNTGKIIVL